MNIASTALPHGLLGFNSVTEDEVYGDISKVAITFDNEEHGESTFDAQMLD